MVESELPSLPGLGLLPITTHFQPDKTTARVQARMVTPSFLTDGQPLETPLAGYEIHAGEVALLAGARPLLRIERRNDQTSDAADGAVRRRGGGHAGAWAAGQPRAARRACWPICAGGAVCAGAATGDRRPTAGRPLRPLGRVLQQHLDWPRIRALAGLP